MNVLQLKKRRAFTQNFNASYQKVICCSECLWKLSLFQQETMMCCFNT